MGKPRLVVRTTRYSVAEKLLQAGLAFPHQDGRQFNGSTGAHVGNPCHMKGERRILIHSKLEIAASICSLHRNKGAARKASAIGRQGHTGFSGKGKGQSAVGVAKYLSDLEWDWLYSARRGTMI
jgi:hypothetical protein